MKQIKINKNPDFNNIRISYGNKFAICPVCNKKVKIINGKIPRHGFQFGSNFQGNYPQFAKGNFQSEDNCPASFFEIPKHCFILS